MGRAVREAQVSDSSDKSNVKGEDVDGQSVGKARQKHRVMSMAANLKAIAKDPGRCTWVAFRRYDIEEMLGRCKELNENLHQRLMGSSIVVWQISLARLS